MEESRQNSQDCYGLTTYTIRIPLPGAISRRTMRITKVERILSAAPLEESFSFSRGITSRDTCPTLCYHRFPARFLPQLARNLIECYSHPNDTVYDPMCGSGTVPTQARFLGRKACASDIHPLSVLITRARSTLLDPAFLLEARRKLLARTRARITAK